MAEAFGVEHFGTEGSDGLRREVSDRGAAAVEAMEGIASLVKIG